MKLWMYEENNPSHTLVKFYAEAHSDYRYIGDLDEAALQTLFSEIDPKMDFHQNLKRLKYYGFLTLFVIKK